MSQLERQVIEGFGTLPPERQQEVLDFVEFLKARTGELPAPAEEQTESQPSILEAARKYIGCVEGPGDLSTNKQYMEGYGT